MSDNIKDYKTQVDVKETESGELYIEFPPTLCSNMEWDIGDDLKFTDNKDGSFTIKKVKMSTIELDFDDEEYFKYLQIAHERDMSFNEWVEEALTCAVDMLGGEEDAPAN